MEPRPRILCVDDEPKVLEGLALHLHRRFDLTPTTSGDEALQTLARSPFAVILSDMRMPGMDGATLLARARELAPETTRVLLTGHAEVGAAIAAVNRGGIFRFLTKPCPPAELRAALEEAVVQHQLVTAERELLEQTLVGSIRALTEILSLVSPHLFGRATRIRQLAVELAEGLGFARGWALEAAAMLSQLGYVSVPDEVVAKVERGDPLEGREREIVERVPEVTRSLLAHIPRIEPVRALLESARGPTRSQAELSREAATEAGILRIAIDFTALETRGFTTSAAIDTLRGRGDRYDAGLLEALQVVREGSAGREEIRELPLRALREGMTFVEDVRTASGLLLAPRGFRVSASFLERARNFASGYVREPLRVALPAEP